MKDLRRRLGVATIGVLVVGLALSTAGANAAVDDQATGGDGRPVSQDATQGDGYPAEIAFNHLREDPAGVGVRSADVADLAVASAYRSAHNGVTHVNLSQRFDGLEVFGAYATVNVASDGEVLFVGDSLVNALASSASGTSEIDALEAVEAAAEALDLDSPKQLRVLSRRAGTAQQTVVSAGGVSDEPIPTRIGWQPTDDGLRLAWQMVIDDSADSHLWNATVDAETGELLAVDDWTSQDSLADLASALARPDGPPSSALASNASALLSPDPVDDGSSYRVFALPAESPNDAPRTLVTIPADAAASPFGWHDTDGAAGPEFSITRGNNAHAYLDQDRNNQPDPGFDVDGGDGLGFDFDADLAEHAQNYRDAAVTNLFYWNNIVHDVTYQYGFDEPAGNFQANNYGRGGTGGDFVRAEAADGAGVDNANFSTPAVDGTGTPRMQMFLWPGNQFGAQNQVVVDGVGDFGGSWARFSPAPTNAGLPGREIVYVGTGCDADLYPDPLPASDWMVIVDGVTGAAGCTHVVRSQLAQAHGADAVIVASTTATAPILTGAITPPRVEIPVVGITQADGNAIKAAVAAGTTTADVRKHPDHPGIRDGDFENSIVIHEYGHGVSLRLTGGPTVNCLTGAEQAGEGWSDYLAIAMLLDPALDDPEGPRGMGPYAEFQDDRQGAGIRSAPYSRNMEIQPFTYDSIKTSGWLDGATLAPPHGIGHGWAAVLWDMTWNLIDKHGFNPDVYGDWDTGGNNRAIQYVIDGLKFQGCNPGLVDARDAIIAAADHLSDGEDTCTVWASFARRGLGYSATQGSSANRDDNGEAFDTHPDCLAGFVGGVSDQPMLNVVNRGATVPLTFTLGGDHGLDILVKNSPYSRQVNCTTRRTETLGSESITPRPLPIATQTQGAGLIYNAGEDRYTYRWRTLAEWAGTCREFVLTRDDGFQHRAFFSFQANPASEVAGRVQARDGRPVANASVMLDGPVFSRTTTDENGFYSLGGVPRGTYEATASADGCDPQTQTLDLSRQRSTLNFTLNCAVWVARYDGPASGPEFAHGMTTSPDGARVFVTGQSPGVGTNLDYATVAYDAATGEELWVARYDGPAASADHALAVGVSPDGSRVFVTGRSAGVGTGIADYATVAYDAATGDEQWVARYDGPAGAIDIAGALGVSADGSRVYVTGQSQGAGTSYDYATVAYDTATGEEQWVARYDGPASRFDDARALGVSADGLHVFVTGSSAGVGTGDDYATVAYDAATGEERWVARYDGPAGGTDGAGALGVNADGSRVFVTGGSAGVGTGTDYATVAYDPATGDEQWVARYNGPAGSTDGPGALGVSPDGSDVFVTGQSLGVGTLTDYATVAYDAATGGERWVARYDGPAGRLDNALAVGVSPDGSGVFVTGYSRGVGTGDDYATVAYDAAGGGERWVARYDGPAGGADNAQALGVSADGSGVFVTGNSPGAGTGNDYATVAYDAALGGGGRGATVAGPTASLW